MCFGDRLHNANLKARISRAKVAGTNHALSDVTAFLKAAASSILRSLILWLNGDSLPSEVHLLKKGNVKPVKSSFNDQGLIIV